MAQFDMGHTWFCGHVFAEAIPYQPTMDELGDDAAYRCGRWHATKEARDGCTHGGGVPVATVDPGDPFLPRTDDPGGQSDDRVRNAVPGWCQGCGRSVRAGKGFVTPAGPVHDECLTDQANDAKLDP